MHYPPPQGPYGYPPQPPPPPYAPPAVVYVQQTATVVKAPFNHGVHILLDFLSCGAWLPIHLICWALH